MEIRNLGNTDFETLFHGFEKAFSDYEIKFEKMEVQTMLSRRGFTPELSFAAFDHGEIVSFTFNGIGTFNGLSTAYDTGTGTVKEYRGQGLAGKIFDYSIPYLKDAGVGQYLLEVLQNNTSAISAYRKMGFEVSREFDCFRQQIDLINNAAVNTDCTIAPIGTNDVMEHQAWCDCTPSWQNGMESIVRGEGGLQRLGAFIDGEMKGFCVFDPSSGDLSQLAVKHDCRNRHIASRLLHEALTRFNTDFIKVLNIDSTDTTMHAFLAGRNIPLASRQFEMLLSL